MTESSTELWRRWRSGRDDRAFAALVVPEIARAVAVARGAGCDGSAAEDAVQDALVGLAQERTDAPVEIGLRVWLFRAVRDRARSSLRSERRRRRREESSARPEASAGPVPRAETAEVVERALDRLDPADREAVRLRCALDLEYEEVANVLGTSSGAARVRVHRALERLRARLGDDAATLLAALPLPVVARPEAFAANAVADAALAATAGTVAAATGGVLMVSGKAVVAAGVVAFAAGAAASWTASHTGASDAVDGEDSVPKPVASSVDRAPAKRAARPGEDRPQSRDSRPEPARAGALEDLAPTESERVWLREALLAERQRRESAAIRPGDGGTEILDRWLRHGADVAAVLTDFATAAEHVRTGTAAAHEIASTGETTAADPPADATVLQFGAGRFTLGPKWRTWSSRRTDAETIEIRGAGADRTTIVANSDLLFCWEAATLKHVRIRDLTIESVENLIDIRGAVSVALEGVRIVGWQSAGHSSPMGVSGRAFLACRDCEFVGSDGIGVVSLRGPGAVVFEKCSFFDVQATVLGGGAASGGRPSVVRFVDCRFENARVADSRMRTGRDVEVDLRVRGGRVALLGDKATEEERRKAWGAEYAESVEGVAFGPSAPLFTGADLLRVLELAEARGWSPVVAAATMRATRGAPPRIDLYFAGADKVERRVVDLVDGALREVGDVRDGARGISALDAATASSLVSLRTLLAGVPDLGSDGADGIEYLRGNVNGAERWIASVRWSGGRRVTSIDAHTGSVLGR